MAQTIMKRQIFLLLALGSLACALQAAADQQPEQKTDQKPDYSKMFKDDREKNRYAMGMFVGESVKSFLKRMDADLDPDVVINAFKDVVSGGTTPITDEEDREIYQAFQKEMQLIAADKRKLLGEKNKKDSEAFLAQNK